MHLNLTRNNYRVSEWSSPSKKSVAKKSGSDVPKKDKIPWLENIFKTKQMAQLPIEQVSSTHIKFGANEIPRIFGNKSLKFNFNWLLLLPSLYLQILFKFYYANLGLCFGPYPLYYQRGVGWGFLVPRASIAKDEKTLLGALERPGIEEIKIPEKQAIKSKSIKFILLFREILNLIAENKQLGISDIDYERWTHAGIIGIFEFYRLPHPASLLFVNCYFSIRLVRLEMAKMLVRLLLKDLKWILNKKSYMQRDFLTL